ncbi:MAG: hypothetical protein OEW19_04475 [Acidobacteriota bacterium]|nr:hypothetical protein [Acidobacteriota bacterium]
MFELKPLSPSAIPAALVKAERYRLLNEPEQAQSICEDVLAADPSNRQATVTLLLALTDRFPHHDGRLVARAQELVARLDSAYERAYYAGLIAERRARALLHRGGPGITLSAGDWLREAMSWYERAEGVRPPDNDDARLRWNACARMFGEHPQLLVQDEERTTPAMLE